MVRFGGTGGLRPCLESYTSAGSRQQADTNKTKIQTHWESQAQQILKNMLNSKQIKQRKEKKETNK